ncbi:hypothetical protein SEA_FLAGSTAFF_61 [Mycobacterium phage FlagStaff]|uniref:Uncharacterized protein n=1 Tax=Mycobacterium phage FlagStaff TaxID=1647304 RepID=A0A0F6WE29_9CAUD|nr:hypothetical protein AVT49_gp61 [Mycobacterium phage FlagStaff]AKF14498.1 hypothetical protein SEA_FLAGSTAFF_61 [Mycobacterium phage FlagStaff]
MDILRTIADSARTAVQGIWGVGESLYQLHRKADHIMASIDEVRAAYRQAFQDVKDQRDQAIALAEANAQKAQERADALAQFQADDAATDASQLAAQQQADADAFASDLAALKDQVATTPAEPDVPPLDEDQGASTPPATGPAPVEDDSDVPTADPQPTAPEPSTPDLSDDTPATDVPNTDPAPVPDDVAGTPDDGSGDGTNVVPPVVSE